MLRSRTSNVVTLPRRRRMRTSVGALLRLPQRAESRQPGATASTAISDYELHALIDGQLDAAQRERVQVFLARHPRAAAEAADYRRQNRMLRELGCRRMPHSPAVGYLVTQLAHRLMLARRGRALAWGAAAALAAAAWTVISGDWTAVPHAILTAGR